MHSIESLRRVAALTQIPAKAAHGPFPLIRRGERESSIFETLVRTVCSSTSRYDQACPSGSLRVFRPASRWLAVPRCSGMSRSVAASPGRLRRRLTQALDDSEEYVVARKKDRSI